MSTTSKLLQLASVTAMVFTGLRCMHQIQTRWMDNNESTKISTRVNNINALSASIIDAVIKENINIPNEMDYSLTMLELTNIQKMKQKHATNMIHLNEDTWKKPVLLIIDPAELLLDPQLITITDDINGTQLDVTMFTTIIREYNKDTLKFALGSDSSDQNQIYAMRPKLIYFMSWLYRLSNQFGVKFEIIAYSNILDDIKLISFLSLIEVYYNAVIREIKDTKHWFRFIGAISVESDYKILQDIASIFPFQDYESVFVIDSDKSGWNINGEYSKNVIGIEMESYTIGISEGTLNNVASFGLSDNYLSLLIEVFKHFVTSKEYRDELYNTVMDDSNFWNRLTFNGNLEGIN
eukprot:95913_1